MLRTFLATGLVVLPLGLCAPTQHAPDGVPATEALGQAEQALGATENSSGERNKLPLGINLASLHPRDTSVAFGNVFLQSSRWFPWKGDPTFGLRRRDRNAMKGRGGVEKDEFGWPLLKAGETVFTRVFEATNGHYPGGTYLCSWRGEGSLKIAGDARMGKVEVTQDAQGTLRSAEVKVQPGRYGIAIVIEKSDPENHIRDIRLLLPGYSEEQGPFTDRFLKRLEPFGVLRFMNWQSIYTNKGVWSERTLKSNCRQTGVSGVAIEWMIELCNTTDKDPWFCMPHLADDEYVRNFAELVRETLEPERTVYIEYSNECWNSIFPETKWINDRARELGIKPATVVAQETTRDFLIWNEVFDAAAAEDVPAPGLVRVIGAALHNPGFARGIMGAMECDFDAVAVAPYFGVRPGKDPVNQRSSAEELLKVARQNITEHLAPRIKEHAALAEAASRRQGHPVRLMAYEGGQTLIARNSTTPGDSRMAFSEKTIQETQYRTEMYEGYRELFAACQDAGMELFVAFHLCGTHASGNTFGLLEWIDQPLEQSVKYRAMLQEWVQD